MTSLPSQHPTLSLHLSDRNLHPILTSAHSDTQLEALTSLATTSLTAHSAAHRLALGHPQRLIVEHGPGNPVLLASYHDPAATPATSTAAPRPAPSYGRSDPASSTAVHDTATIHLPPVDAFAAVSISDASKDAPRTPKSKSRTHTRDTIDNSKQKPKKTSTAPMLVGLVVASSTEEALEARRAAVRLERVAREVQREWIAEEQERGYASDESG